MKKRLSELAEALVNGFMIGFGGSVGLWLATRTLGLSITLTIN